MSEPVAASLGSTLPARLLAELGRDAGGPVDGAAPGDLTAAPPTSGLAPSRAEAVLAAWTGAELHAGKPAALRCEDPDLALLVGDWCFAHALQALAHTADLVAIGALAEAIGGCAVALTEAPDPVGSRTAIWTQIVTRLQPRDDRQTGLLA